MIPEGNEAFLFVRVGNLLAARCVLIILLVLAKDARFLLEQPTGSCFRDGMRWQWLLTIVEAPGWQIFVCDVCFFSLFM
jgi:hypothetical protein